MNIYERIYDKDALSPILSFSKVSECKFSTTPKHFLNRIREAADAEENTLLYTYFKTPYDLEKIKPFTYRAEKMFLSMIREDFHTKFIESCNNDLIDVSINNLIHILNSSTITEYEFKPSTLSSFVQRFYSLTSPLETVYSDENISQKSVLKEIENFAESTPHIAIDMYDLSDIIQNSNKLKSNISEAIKFFGKISHPSYAPDCPFIIDTLSFISLLRPAFELNEQRELEYKRITEFCNSTRTSDNIVIKKSQLEQFILNFANTSISITKSLLFTIAKNLQISPFSICKDKSAIYENMLKTFFSILSNHPSQILHLSNFFLEHTFYTFKIFSIDYLLKESHPYKHFKLDLHHHRQLNFEDKANRDRNQFQTRLEAEIKSYNFPNITAFLKTYGIDDSLYSRITNNQTKGSISSSTISLIEEKLQITIDYLTSLVPEKYQRILYIYPKFRYCEFMDAIYTESKDPSSMSLVLSRPFAYMDSGLIKHFRHEILKGVSEKELTLILQIINNVREKSTNKSYYVKSNLPDFQVYERTGKINTALLSTLNQVSKLAYEDQNRSNLLNDIINLFYLKKE